MVIKFNGLSTKECTRTFTNNEKITKMSTISYTDTEKYNPRRQSLEIYSLPSSIRIKEKVKNLETAL